VATPTGTPRTPDPLRLEVRAAVRTYPVLIGPGTLQHLATLLGRVGVLSRSVIVSNPTVWALHGRTVAGALPDTERLLIPDGERFKTLQTVSRLYDGLLRAGADRATTLVAVGGGVVGDVAGFAAATFLRGVGLVHVPTTLVAQVDSAIGGKVGVNHPLGKNLVGAFYPPLAVVIDPDVLATLPRREFRAGLYEVVKYGVIASRDLFDRVARDLGSLFARDTGALVPIIAESCRIKAAVVAEDEHEAGRRRILNFGHTVGHALEAVTRYRRFRHGEAVAYGMLAAAEIAAARRWLAPEERDRLVDLLTQMGPLPPVADLSVSATLEAVARDKKVVRGRLHFVLPTAIGQTSIVTDVTDRELRQALRKIGLRR
jgi:3-dehydroquinate synthase